ncbi:MAG TPA: translation elongation factor 4 [bacterium]|nr:translation elongation factor 4 [bacterium]
MFGLLRRDDESTTIELEFEDQSRPILVVYRQAPLDKLGKEEATPRMRGMLRLIRSDATLQTHYKNVDSYDGHFYAFPELWAARLALENNLEIIAAINKVDLPNADPEKCERQLHDLTGIDPAEMIRVSAKSGAGVAELLERVVERVPPPSGDAEAPLQALVFDSLYDVYRGVIVYIRIVNGALRVKDRISFFSTGSQYEIGELGVFRPAMTPVDRLAAGEVGYFVATIREPAEVKTGDTVTLPSRPCSRPLPGFKEHRPVVFSGLYPVNSADYENLKAALLKLHLNDSSFVFQPETSVALGFGFRCGFLGLLHLDIISERLNREYDLDLIMTSPSVVYEITRTDWEEILLDNPVNYPPRSEIIEVREPFIRAYVITPNEHIGQIMQIARERRGECKATESLGLKSVILTFELPLNEVVIDFYDLIKSVTHGYGSLDYDYMGYRPSDLVKMEILLNGEPVDAFSSLVHTEKAYYKGRRVVEKLKEVIPRQQFRVAIQAAVDGKVIARETVRPFRKDVTAGLYGGDRTRKDKLLNKQKAGKKRMRQVGKVQVPQKAFIEVMKLDT